MAFASNRSPVKKSNAIEYLLILLFNKGEIIMSTKNYEALNRNMNIFTKKNSTTKVSISALLFLTVFVAAVFSFSNPVRAEEIGPAKWKENSPIFQVYYGVETNDMYEVYYNGEWTPYGDNFSEFEKIHFLMVNGGFVPHNDIIIKNNITMIPTSIIEDIFGAKIDYDNKERTIEITTSDTNITFYIVMGHAKVNGEKKDIEATPFYRNSKIYVPLRFIANALGAEIQYKNRPSSLLYDEPVAGYRIYNKNYDVITIETGSKNKKVFTVEEGVSSLKNAATKIYGESLIIKMPYRDINVHDIKYINNDLGRYYVYAIKGLEIHPIYFNKYTGEIFSSIIQTQAYFAIMDGFTIIPNN